MEGDERRQFILKLLAGSESPLSGNGNCRKMRCEPTDHCTGHCTLTSHQ